MGEILSTGSLTVIHSVICFAILCELLFFSERTVFESFKGIMTKIPKGDRVSLDILINTSQKTCSGKPYTLNDVIKAYSLLTPLKSLSWVIICLSAFYLVFTIFKDVFVSLLPIQAILTYFWYALIVLDFLLFVLRGKSKIGHLLYELHPNFHNTRIINIILWIYMFK